MEAFNLLFSEERALWEEIPFPRSWGRKHAKAINPVQLLIILTIGEEEIVASLMVICRRFCFPF